MFSVRTLLAATAAAIVLTTAAKAIAKEDMAPLEDETIAAVVGSAPDGFVALNDGDLASVGTNLFGALLSGFRGLEGPVNVVSATIDDGDTVTHAGADPQTLSLSSGNTQVQLDAMSAGGTASATGSVTQTLPTSYQSISTGAFISGPP